MGLLSTLSRETKQHIAYAFSVIFLAIGVGAAGFMYFEGLNSLDAVYFATETVTTVGYGDLAPKTPAGRIFAIFFLLFGVGSVLYALTALAQAIVQAEILSILGKRKKSKEMEKLNKHFIVCGAGRVGNRIIKTLQKDKIPFVLIEQNEKKVEELIEQGEYVIVGDATSEEVLKKAGVHKAKGLVTCLADDASNVYVVLTARGMNSFLHIVSRAVEEEAEPKLIRAGASRVVSPIIIGSHSMSRALLKPAIADFMDSIVAETLDLVFEEVAIESSSQYVSKKLVDTNIRSDLNVVIVAIRRKAGEMIFQPSGDATIEEGDLLITIGTAESIKKLIEASK
jgi:voltage-gated potassium channel